MVKHPKIKKKKPKKKQKSKVDKLTAINAKSLSKAQRRHIKDFGELHPLDTSDFSGNSNRNVKKVSFTENKPSKTQESKSYQEHVDSDEEEPVDPYQQLVGSLSSSVKQKYLELMKNEEEEMEDDDDDDESDGDEGDIETDMEVGSNDKSTEELAETNENVKGAIKNNANGDGSSGENKNKTKEDVSDDDSNDDNDEFGVEDYRQDDDDESDSEDVNDNNIDQDQLDPFTVHFEQDLDEGLESKILNPKAFQQKSEIIPSLGTVTTFLPTFKVPLKEVSANTSQPNGLFKVKRRLCNSWSSLNTSKETDEEFSPIQKKLFPFINSYQDVLYTNRSFENGEDIRKLYCLHAVNHILKTRSRVLKNNAKIVLAQKESREIEDLRDQGLTRPKVLILVPFRNAALKIVNTIIQLLLPNAEGQVMSKKRFLEEYSDSSVSDTKRTFRPDDFEKMFEGNIDDCFRIGLSIMRKAVKLYSHFYSSDILIASPLGLRTILGSEGEKFGDSDFLSSIEVLILDQSDVFLMQNWEHMQHVFDSLHKQPKEAHDVDFSRVRNWCLNGWSKYYRQTLIFSSFFFPELNSLLNKQCLNYAGKTKIQKSELPGTICQVVTQVPQVFHRIECSSHAEAQEKRFNFFVEKIMPEFRGQLMGHTAIFVPSYFDFVRLRNYFRREEISFAHISEYSKRSDITRSRNWFLEGSKAFLLYTERFYFFYRYRIRGIRNIIFYGLPRYAHFYPEILNFLDTGSAGSKSYGSTTPVTCAVLYTKYDSHRLAEIVGSRRCCHMISSHKHVHMFVTGEKSTT